jgi:hypothetical protein
LEDGLEEEEDFDLLLNVGEVVLVLEYRVVVDDFCAAVLSHPPD